MCSYPTKKGDPVEGSMKRIIAIGPEEAAEVYSKHYPGEYSQIRVDQPEEAAAAARAQQEEAAIIARVESLQKLHSSVESADGNLAGLSYIELSALVENLRDFPVMRDKISPEECAVREELYKVAFFDRNLQAELQKEQAELQVELLRDLKSALTGLQSGKSGSGPGKSNLARNVAMMGGLAALQKLTQIEENTGDVSEGLGFD